MDAGCATFQRCGSLTDRRLVPVTDPRQQLRALQPEIQEALQRVLKSGQYILGPEVEAFESEFANYIGTDHAVGVANGTDALALSLRALGIGAGDEVITVSHTAVATVAAIEQAGATPVLVDVEPRFLTLDPDKLEELLTPRTRAIVPVHLYGQAADVSRIRGFCDNHKLAMVEDVSQAHGATWGGARLGTFGEIAAFSCYPTKNLGALGDAGMIVTSDKALADRVRKLRQYGWVERNSSVEPGLNSRLDELQAAVLRIKLQHLDVGNARRRAIAGAYKSSFESMDWLLPQHRERVEEVFHLYVVRTDDRDGWQADLSERGIQTAIHYPNPVHLQPAYKTRLRTSEFMTHTETAAKTVLSLPMFPELADVDIATVTRAVGAVRDTR